MSPSKYDHIREIIKKRYKDGVPRQKVMGEFGLDNDQMAGLSYRLGLVWSNQPKTSQPTEVLSEKSHVKVPAKVVENTAINRVEIEARPPSRPQRAPEPDPLSMVTVARTTKRGDRSAFPTPDESGLTLGEICAIASMYQPRK